MSLMKLLLPSKVKPEHESKSCALFSVRFEEIITEACRHPGHEHQGTSAMIRCPQPPVGLQF